MMTNKEERLYGILVPKDWRERWPAHARLYERMRALSDGTPGCIGDPGPNDDAALEAERAEIVTYAKNQLLD